ncbi:MFS transporter [Streptomyces sp. NBC_00539]|uniref:MFS transporter n=1 Tax=Streptomyces sp. NBC_00539 TaxID=2975770 RepID=UPI002E823832|nr:MFS transporter [Streptomyces sp. NBC_00539]WUC63689.1 MFS transporter [Streptomyces sp. NBC_00539]
MRPLSRNRDFNVFWLGQALSVLGGSASAVALPLLVLTATGSVFRMGLVTVVCAATSVVTATFAGYVVDRVDRRRLMIVCDLARALLLGAVPFLWLAGPRIWLLFLLTAPVGVLQGLFDVAYVTAVPSLVPPEDLVRANGRLMGTFALGTLLGPVIAGVVTGGVGAAWALGLDGATFLVSAVSLLRVRFTPRPDEEQERRPGPGGAGMLREVFAAGFRFLWAHPLLRPLTVLLTLLTFVTVGATDLLIYRVGHDLHQGSATLGYVMATSGLGTLVGAVTAGALRGRLGFGVCWLGSVAATAVGFAGMGVSRSVPVVAVLAALFMFGLTVGGVCSMTLRQEVTPPHLLGRVTSAFWTVHNASGPAGAAALTALAARHGVPAVSLAGGAFCLLLVGAGVLTPLRGSGAATAPAAAPPPVSRLRRPLRGPHR